MPLPPSVTFPQINPKRKKITKSTHRKYKHEQQNRKENKKEISKTKASSFGSLQVFFLHFKAGTEKY